MPSRRFLKRKVDDKANPAGVLLQLSCDVLTWKHWQKRAIYGVLEHLLNIYPIKRSVAVQVVVHLTTMQCYKLQCGFFWLNCLHLGLPSLAMGTGQLWLGIWRLRRKELATLLHLVKPRKSDAASPMPMLMTEYGTPLCFTVIKQYGPGTKSFQCAYV